MEQKSSILLCTTFFGPIQYYTKLLKYETAYIEQYENFNKQTYRNRCVILGGNGPIQLIVPVVKGRGTKILIKDLKISYDTSWQRNQWQTIVSAYNSSPFFEFYQDEILPFFEKEEKYLLDLNQAVNETVCELLEIGNNAILTGDFEEVPEGTINFREVVSPKIKKICDHDFIPVKYTQVFSGKFGFVPNLSILDLLFNEGPNSYSVLEVSIK